MSDIKPFMATPILNFDSYEELAHSSLPDNTVVYSDGEGIKYQESQASGLFFGSSVHNEESLDHQKSREDFSAAIAEKFGDMPTIKDETSPLTLGRVRTVIKEESLRLYQKENKEDPQLARLMGAAIMAKEDAEIAAAHLDSLGYPQQHLEETVHAAQKLLLDAGITAVVVGIASYAAITALMAASSGIAATTLISSVPVMVRAHSSQDGTATEGVIAHTVAAELALAVALHATMLISPQVAAGHAIIQSIPSAVTMLGLTSEKGKEVGQKLAAFLPSVTTSFEAAQEGASELTEAQSALIHAVTTRVVSNALLEEVKKYTDGKSGILNTPTELADPEAGKIEKNISASNVVRELSAELQNDLQKLSTPIKESVKVLDAFIMPNQKRFNEAQQSLFTELARRAATMKTLIETISAGTSLSLEEIEQIASLSEENLSALETISGTLKSNRYVSQFRQETMRTLELTQKIKKFTAPSEQPFSKIEITACYEDFLNAVNAGLIAGSKKITELRKGSLSGEGKRSEAEEKKARNKPFRQPLRGIF